MKDIHKHSFEEEFRKKFEEAEAAPEPTVWAEIDAHLANQEASVYKWKLYYFKIRVAAAAFIIFGFLGVWVLTNYTTPQQQQITGVQSPNSLTKAQPEKAPTIPETAASTQKGTVTESGKGLPSEKIPTEKALKKSALPNKEDTDTANSIEDINGGTEATLAELSEKRQRNKSSFDNKIAKGNNQLLQENNILSDRAVEDPATSKNLNGKNSKNPAPILSNSPGLREPGTTGLLSRKDILTSSNTILINRLNTKIHIDEIPSIVKAPDIKLQINSNFKEQRKEEEKTKSVSKWSMNVAFAPNQFDPNIRVDQRSVASVYNTYSSVTKSFASPTTLSPGMAEVNASPAGNDLENAQTLGISYNIGFNVNYALSERFSVQSGLQYMRNNSQIITTNYLEDFNNRTRYPAFLSLVSNHTLAAADSPMLQYGDFRATTNAYAGVTELAVYNTYQYMSVPVQLQYKIINKKISTSVGAGISADVFLNNTVGNKNANISTTNLDSQASIYKSIGMSGIFSTKLDYEISSRYSVFLEPSYRTALTSFTKSATVRSLPSAFGIGTGFQLTF